MFLRTEKLKDYYKSYPITSIIILLNLLVELYVLLFLNGWKFQWVVFEVGGISQMKISQGEYWRLITYSFLHLGLAHFLFNMVFIYVFSPAIEVALGRIKFILLYLISILSCAAAVLLFTSDSGVGASGFFFGLLGLYSYLLFTKKLKLDLSNRRFIISFTIISWLLTFGFSICTQQVVTILGHFGGFLGGFIYGWLFCPKPYNKPISL